MNVPESFLDDTIFTYEDNIPGYLEEPFLYLDGIPSNSHNIRRQLIMAFNDLFFHIENKEVLDMINEIIRILHVSSLLIDDIEDRSKLRRGYATAHEKYGIPITINSGNMMYFVAIRKAEVELPMVLGKAGREFGDFRAKLSDLITKEMLQLHQGQGLDIYWRDEIDKIKNCLPSFNDYFNMVVKKTGGLFRLSVRLMALCSGKENLELIHLSNLLGILYQVRDDYLNLFDEEYSKSKGCVGEDLVEGNLSCPILHCLSTCDHSPISSMLYDKSSIEEKSLSHEKIDQCIDYLKYKSHSQEFTEQLMIKLQASIIQLIERSAPNMDSSSCKLIKIVKALSKF